MLKAVAFVVPVCCLVPLSAQAVHLVGPGGYPQITAAIAAAAPGAGLARLTTTCPATATPFGAGCTGSGGANVLTSTSLPWSGSSFSARATGMAAGSLAVAAWAFQSTQIPMPLVHPQGQPGCSLLVQDEILIAFSVVQGTVDTTIAVPPHPSLVGATFFHQVVLVEVGAVGNITSLTSTNALTLTIGVF